MKFLIQYVDATNSPVSHEVTDAENHWDACAEALRMIPDGASDFQVEQLLSLAAVRQLASDSPSPEAPAFLAWLGKVAG